MSGVLVVTGGSRGIGAAVCRLGAERGYAVCVNYVGQAARATEVVQAIQSRGGMAIAVQADVSREDDVEPGRALKILRALREAAPWGRAIACVALIFQAIAVEPHPVIASSRED